MWNPSKPRKRTSSDSVIREAPPAVCRRGFFYADRTACAASPAPSSMSDFDLRVGFATSSQDCVHKVRFRLKAGAPQSSEMQALHIRSSYMHLILPRERACAGIASAGPRPHVPANARHIWESPLLRKREGAFFMPIPAQRPPAAMGRERVEEHHPRTLTCAARSCKRKGRKVAESGNDHQETAGRTRKHAAWGSRGRWFESSPPDQRNRRSDGKNVWPAFHFRAPSAARCCTSAPSSIKV